MIGITENGHLLNIVPIDLYAINEITFKPTNERLYKTQDEHLKTFGFARYLRHVQQRDGTYPGGVI
jgi:hypothetical protein